MFHRTAVASTTSASASVKRTLSFLKSASSPPTAALNGKLAQNESVNASSVVPGNSSNTSGKNK